MEKRSIFDLIFGSKKPNQDVQKYGQTIDLVDGSAIWTNYDGNFYDDSIVRACIDAIARNGAKLNPKHIRYTDDGFKNVYGRTYRLISKRPNELMNGYDFLYKIISQLYTNNNAFVYIQRDEFGNATGLYPLDYNTCKMLEYKGEVYVNFSFKMGNSYTASLKDDIIHLKRFFNKSEVYGGSSKPIVKTMSIRHVLDEGIMNAIRTTNKIRGILKNTKTMMAPEDIIKQRDAFVKDFLADNESGIAGLDSTMDFIPVTINPQSGTDGQMTRIDDEVLNYFGVSREILQSNYNEDQWNAFYESVIEPIAIMLSLEFTNKIFTVGERWHGNEIVFESNRLQYASNNTKVAVVSALLPYGILKKNEAREIFNLAPVEGGEEFIQSLNNINSDIADGYQGDEL